jgi:uncharacterized protein YeaO (DUF488 family)
VAEDLGVHLLRIYVADDDRDSRCRVLVDRLWPRGVSKADADLHEWLKDVASSSDLRKWYGHDVGRFDEFARRYRGELQAGPASAGLQHLVALARDHAGALPEQIRDRTDGYTVPPDGCASYQALYRALAELESDLHLHVDIENNRLFPMVVELEASGPR